MQPETAPGREGKRGKEEGRWGEKELISAVMKLRREGNEVIEKNMVSSTWNVREKRQGSTKGV